MTRRELWDTIHTAAAALYDGHETRAVTALLCEELFGMRFTDAIVEPSAPCPDGTGERAVQVVKELRNARPVQYIIGHTDFCGKRFNVREGVLIPRPETEELVRWIVEEAGSDTLLRILDIGTGSGCIAVSLAAHLPGAEVTALDISPEALAIAAENARQNEVQVRFAQGDILQELPRELSAGGFDLIVSNPPYVTESEKGAMRPNVLQYEPSGALFVPDNDPLLFYRTIARKGRTLLRPGGKLYFEINERLGDETLAVLEREGYTGGEVRRDLFDKERMVRAWLS